MTFAEVSILSVFGKMFLYLTRVDFGFIPGLEECLQSRPPLQLDLTGPKPTSYDPPISLPWETSSPCYTMRPKTQPERGINNRSVFVHFSRAATSE